MAWTDKQVDDMIYKILDAAEGYQWKIDRMPANMQMHNGSIQIRGERQFIANTLEEVDLMMEAFERMVNELYHVQHHNGVVWRVTKEGREALKQYRQKIKSASKSLNVVGLCYGPDDYTAMTDWEEVYNAGVVMIGLRPAFRDNAFQKVIENHDEEIDGFLIVSPGAFKPVALTHLYQTAKNYNYHLYAVERGNQPFGDEDVEDSKSENTAPGTTVVNVTISGNQNTVATHGGINREITNHLKIVEETNPDIALVLKEFAAAVQGSSLEDEPAKQILSRIDDLAEAISQKPPKEKYWSIVDRTKVLCEQIVAVVAINHSVQYLMQHADKLLPLITTTFGGG
jgi:hypothetical protein